MSIEVERISKVFGQQYALRDVSLTIGRGEVVGLLGPNGAGKSTLMKIITCFIPPTSGQARVFGHSIFEEPLEVRRRIGYLPESNPLYTDMYVKEYLSFIAGLHGISNPAVRVADMIEKTGLTLEQKKKIGTLSKGYRQRVGLAQAIIHNPDVLILDEPTSGLDPNQLVEIRQLIRELGHNKTVVLSTHIMQEVEAVCSRVVIINQGQIVADEGIEKLAALAAGETVLEVEFSGPADLPSLSRLRGVRDVKDNGQHAYTILTDASLDLREAIFNYAVEHQLKILSQRIAGRKLEDVFQTLTRGSGPEKGS
ncbi:MAG: gliding motility-associated ABC transporter ATP-binding subunit GldA [Lentimicrobiaceae bacterium]|nr:gliding motility-associated ABC transporter ATP-binding subunit GldA [Lentimicrobiaceae bacterium]